MWVPTSTAHSRLAGALLLWALGAAWADDDCPQGCECSPVQLLDMICELPRTNVSVKGEPGSSIMIICDPEENQNFTINELPQMQYGQGADIRLSFKYCTLPPSLGDVAQRLGAASIQALYIHEPPDGVVLNPENVRGLTKLEGLAVYTDKTDNITIPKEVFSELPSLRRLTINNGQALLTPDMFSTAPGLTYLELGNVHITRLPDGVFSSLGKLEKLYMWRNQIEELTEQQLSGLAYLQQLDVSTNRLTSLAGVVTSLPTLRYLSAFNNRFDVLPSLSNLKMLEKVDIFDNRVSLNVTPRALASLPQLTHVNLCRSGIQHLPADMLAGSGNLKVLKLIGNQLNSLPLGLFSDQAVLDELDLSYNQLEELQPRLFHQLKALTSLNLNNNRLVMLASNVLSGLSSLRELRVSFNRLTALSPNSLAGATRLEEVYLSHNNITDPEPETASYYEFSNTFAPIYSSLQVLDLSHNSLRAMPADLPRTTIYLRLLDLSYNKIKEIIDSNFMSNHAIVDLTHNEIEMVYLYPALPPSSMQYSAPHNRSRLLLDYNPFRCDCHLYSLAQRLHGYSTLDTTEVDFVANNTRCASPPKLAGLHISQIPLDAFTCTFNDSCPKLCTCEFHPHTSSLKLVCSKPPINYPDLSLSGASELHLRLTKKPEALLIGADIKQLNLSGLGIKELPKDLALKNVALLDLSYNNFTVIPSELFLSSLDLDLAGNPILCDCWHSDDIQVLLDNAVKIKDFNQVYCSSGSSLQRISPEQLCSTWRAAVIGGVLALIGFIAAITALLILKYSFEIKVWLYTRGMFARWLVIDDDDRKYDAFISFCHKDEEFVNTHLLPTLEKGPQPYKLCIHYRDWMPGEFITTQIAQSVADSRRTIIVVSRNFLNSQWARAEFRTANMSAIKEKKTRVIAILLEDVNSHKELDPELKAYLSTNTYLKWGDPWFWDKLRYALPHRKEMLKEKAKIKVREMVALEARKMADEVNKMAVEKHKMDAYGLDARLTQDGLIINAAAIAVPKEKCEQNINLDICKIKNMKSMV